MTDSSPAESPSIFLFDTFQIQSPQNAFSRLPLPARRLLAYLILTDAPRHREQIPADVCPAHHLPQTVAQLTGELPRPLITVDGGYLAFVPSPHIWVDVHAFTAEMAPYLGTGPLESDDDLNAVQKAVAIYRGELLHDWHPAWVTSHRWHYRQLYHHGLERLIAAEKRHGRYEAALRHAFEYVRSDPMRDATHRLVMRLYLSQERYEDALGQYEACRRELNKHNLTPEPETENLAQELNSILRRPPTADLTAADSLSLHPTDDDTLQREIVWQTALFGAPALTKRGDPQTWPPLAAAGSLLAYLLMHRHRALPRTLLVTNLWPEQPEDKARRLLSYALWYLRRIFGDDDVIDTPGDTVQIPPTMPILTDVEIFEQLLAPHLRSKQPLPQATSDLRQAVQLYAGELMAGSYDEWLETERRRLKQLYTQALEKLLVLEKQAGRYGQALTYAHKLLDEDPYHEPTHREIMRLYVAQNRPQEAVRQFESCRQILQEELQIEPDPQTQRLASEIRRRFIQPSEEAPYLPAPDTPPTAGLAPFPTLSFVGRTEERRRIKQIIDRLFTSENEPGSLLLVAGEAGIGKTRLVETSVKDAVWRGAHVLKIPPADAPNAPLQPLLRAVAEQLTPLRVQQLYSVTKSVWLQVLAPHLPTLREHLPTLPSPPSLPTDQAKTRLINALTYTLIGWSKITPVLLVVEDLHQRPFDMLDILHQMLTQFRAHPICVIGTYRPMDVHTTADVSEAIDALTQDVTHHLISPGRLEPRLLKTLVQRTLNAPRLDPALETHLYEQSEGNPLFALEMVRTLHEKGLLYRDPETDKWRLEGTLPSYDNVDLLIRDHLSLLLPAVKHTLGAAAVIGATFDYQTVAAVTELPPETLIEHINQLTRADFIIEEQDEYRFTHAKLHEGAYDFIIPEERRRFHRQTADYLAAQPNNPGAGVLSHHYRQAQAWENALRYTAEAAVAAREQFAYQTAHDLYSQALDLISHLPAVDQETQVEILLARTELNPLLQKWEMQAADIGRLYQFDLAPPQLIAVQHLEASLLTLHHAQFEKAQHLLQESLKLARSENLIDLQAKTLIQLAYSHYQQTRRLEPAAGYAAEAHKLLKHIDDSLKNNLANIYHRLYYAALNGGDMPSQQHHRDLFFNLVEELNDPILDIRRRGVMAIEARVNQQQAQMVMLTEENLRAADTLGIPSIKVTVLQNLIASYVEAQRWKDAIKNTIVWLALVQRKVKKLQGHQMLGALYRLTGQYKKAIQALQQGETYIDSGSVYQGLLWVEYGLLHLDQDQRQSAKKAFETAVHIKKTYPFQQVYFHVAHGRLFEVLGQTADAHHAYQTAYEMATDRNRREQIFLSAACLAVTTQAQGDDETAVRLAQEAFGYLDSGTYGEEVEIAYYNIWCVLSQTAEHKQTADDALDRAYALIHKQRDNLPPEWHQDFFEKVPRNRRILAAYQQRDLERRKYKVAVSLPSRQAPARGPLEDGHTVTVYWTPTNPDDEKIKGKRNRRHHQIKRLYEEALEQEAVPTADDLADALDVSKKTILRDLKALQKAGHEIITRGQLR